MKKLFNYCTTRNLSFGLYKTNTPDIIGKPESNYLNGDLDVNIINSVCMFKLNRPKALNSLSYDMIRNMKQTIMDTKDNPDIRFYTLHADESSKLFCAGGDIKALYKEGVPRPGMRPIVTPESMNIRRHFFRDEYTLLYLIAKMKKDFICFIENSAIGGGVGLIAHGSHSIMKSNTTVRMPECTIGFFPDVGSGAFLGWLPYSIGVAVGLCGMTLPSNNAAQLGIITQETNKPLERIFDRALTGNESWAPFSKAMRRMSLGFENLNPFKLVELYDYFTESDLMWIDDIFSQTRCEDVVEMVRHMATKDLRTLYWITSYNNICASSPTSLKVTLRYLQTAKNLSLEDCFKYEYRIAANFMRHHDFYEGVRAKLIDKCKPQWNPPFLEDVTDEMVDKFFELPDGESDLIVENESKKISSIGNEQNNL